MKNLYVSLVGESIPPNVIERFCGVGLIRGEFIQRRVQRSMLTPDVRETLSAYLRTVAARFCAREVWYRTMDLWTEEGNTLVGSSFKEDERNPIVGVRGGRRARRAPDEFKAECETIAAVCADHPNLRVLFPFVGDGSEFAWLAETARAHGVTCPLGSMIEVPSAAICADEIIAAGATRLLVGMNDLSCLVTGSARSLEFDKKMHRAVWELIDVAVRAAKATATPIGMAGALSLELIARGEAHGMDFASIHYSQARKLLDPHSEPWPDEGLETKIKETTFASIERFNVARWTERLSKVAK